MRTQRGGNSETESQTGLMGGPPSRLLSPETSAEETGALDAGWPSAGETERQTEADESTRQQKGPPNGARDTSSQPLLPGLPPKRFQRL